MVEMFTVFSSLQANAKCAGLIDLNCFVSFKSLTKGMFLFYSLLE